MKTFRLPILAALLFGLSALTMAFAAPPAAPKAKTFAIVGFVDGPKPSPALQAQAIREIGAKMQGLTQVQNPEDADHVVQVLFKRGAYKVYVDALPFNPSQSRDAQDKLAAEIAYRAMIHMERLFEPGNHR